MALHKSKASHGKPSHKNPPGKGYQHITKPEDRHGTTHNYTVAQADAKIKKVHC